MANRVFVWGRNTHGQLGIPHDQGTNQSCQMLPSPIDFFSDKTISIIACGGSHSIAVTEAGDVYSWGSSDHGQLGHGDERDSATPKLIKSLVLVKALQSRVMRSVVCGLRASFAVTDSGQLYHWGAVNLSNDADNNGSGGTECLLRPTLMTRLYQENIRQVSCVGEHTAAVAHSGKLYTWGLGKDGRLGHGDFGNRAHPEVVRTLLDEVVIAASCGNSHTAALTDDGTLFTWGKGSDGQLGHGGRDDSHLPRVVEVLWRQGIVQVVCGFWHTLCVLGSGELYAWGWGEGGQLGHGARTSALYPHKLVLPQNQKVASIAAGAYHSLCVLVNGEVLAWGTGSYGQLGVVFAEQQPLECLSPTPLPVTVAPNSTTPGRQVQALSAGWWHCMAIVGEQVKPPHLPSKVHALLSEGEETAAAAAGGGAGGHGEEGGSEHGKMEGSEIEHTAGGGGGGGGGSSSGRNSTGKKVGESPFRKLQSWLHRRTKTGSSSTSRGEVWQRLPETAQDQADLAFWEKDILPHWEEKRSDSKVKQRFLAGIPPSLRGVLWPAAIGNSLGLDGEVFEQLRSEVIKEHEVALQMAALSGEGLTSDSQRQAGGGHSYQIEKDLTRTFASLAFFSEGGPFHEDLRTVLSIYAKFRPDMGYVQGMSYLAATLLLYMEAYPAFVCLANILSQKLLLSLYRLDVEILATVFRFYDEVVLANSKQLHQHFKRLNVTPDMYVVDWLLTLFSRPLNLDVASRVWDAYIIEGELYIIQAAVGVLKYYESELLESSFEGVLTLLNKLPSVEEAELMQHINAVTISRRQCTQFYDALSHMGYG